MTYARTCSPIPEFLLMIIYVCILLVVYYEFVLFTSRETGESPQVLPLRPPHLSRPHSAARVAALDVRSA